MAAERDVTCSQHRSNAGERNPHIGCDPNFTTEPEVSDSRKTPDFLPGFPFDGVCYQQEMLSLPKDTIYAAKNAIQLALGYMPQINTDVPQWKATLEADITRMQAALESLKKLY